MNEDVDAPRQGRSSSARGLDVEARRRRISGVVGRNRLAGGRGQGSEEGASGGLSRSWLT